MAKIITHPKDREGETIDALKFYVHKETEGVWVEVEHHSGEYFTLILNEEEIKSLKDIK